MCLCSWCLGCFLCTDTFVCRGAHGQIVYATPVCVCVLCLRVFVVYSHADFLKRKEGKPRAHQGGLPRATRGQFVVFFFLFGALVQC